MSKFNRRHPPGKENIRSGVDNVARPRSTLPRKDATEVGSAKAAPDFGKLHKQWDQKLAKGKAVKKKPLTSVQPFQLSQISNRTNPLSENKVELNSTKENTLTWNSAANNTKSSRVPVLKSAIPRLHKPLSQLQQTVSRIQPPAKTLQPPKVQPKFSSKIHPPSKLQQPGKHTVVSKAENKTEVKTVVGHAVQPVVVTHGTNPPAKAPLAEPKLPTDVAKPQTAVPAQNFKVDFKCDDAALDSILNGEGIQLPTKSPSRFSSKVGPARRDKGSQRMAPFTKPSGNRLSLNRLSTNYTDQNAARQRWSIYKRDSFSTKPDLMTWLQSLSGVTRAATSTTTAATTTTAMESANMTSTFSSNSNSSNAESTYISSMVSSISDIPVSLSGPSHNHRPTKFRHSLIGFQTLTEETEVENTTKTEKGEDNQTQKTKKSILKKPSLMPSDEIQKRTVEVKAEVKETKKKEIRTPLRGKKVVRVTETIPEAKEDLRERMKEVLTPTRGARKVIPQRERMEMDAENQEKRDQRQSSKPLRTPSRTPSRSAQKGQHPIKQNLMFTPSGGSSTPRKVLEEENTTMDESCLLSTKKRVHWNSDLTYLSPVDASPADDLNEENKLDRECAVKLFCNDDTVLEEKVELKMESSQSSLSALVEVDEVMWTTTSSNDHVSSSSSIISFNASNMSSDYNRNTISPISIPNLISTVDSPIPPKPANNAQSKESAAASALSGELLLKITESPLEEQKPISTMKEVVSSSNTLNSWADILGSICTTSAPGTPSAGTSVASQVFASSVNRTPTTPAQKARKKKRCSILEQIYGGSNRAGDPSAEKKSVQNNFTYNSISASQCVSVPSTESLLFPVQPVNGCSLRVVASGSNSPAILRRNVKVPHNPSTVVTYSKSVHNVLYGDNKHPQSPVAQRSPSPLIKFSNLFDNTISGNKELLNRELSSTIAKEQVNLLNNSLVSSVGMTPLCPEPLFRAATADVSNGFKSNTPKSAFCAISEHETPRRPLVETSEARSAQLEKYVTTLLNSPPQSQCQITTENVNTPAKASPVSLEQCKVTTSTTMTLPSTNLDSSDDSDEGCNQNNSDEDVCVVFSTPFKRGLYNHLVQSSSFIGVRKSSKPVIETTLLNHTKPSTPTNQIHCGATSAFCRIIPKNIEPTPTAALVQSSEEMIWLHRNQPTALHTVDVELDTQVSLVMQSTPVPCSLQCASAGVRCVNPVSIVLSVGDDIHFPPIHDEDNNDVVGE